MSQQRTGAADPAADSAHDGAVPGAVTRRRVLQLSGRLLTVGAGLTALGGLAAACAPSSGGAGTAGDAEPKAGALTDDGVKDFTFTTWSMNEAASKEQLQALLDTYTRASGSTITTPSFPYNDYLQQFLLQVRGGEAAGAAQLDISWLATLAASGKLVDLGAVAKEVDYTAEALKVGQHEGVQYGLPWTTSGIGLIGNQELLDRAGVTQPPATIEEFEAALEALKGLGGGVIPYAAMTKLAQMKDILAWMWAFGSPTVDGGKVTVDDDASVEAVTWMKKLYDAGLVAPDVDRFDARALFAQGKVGYYEDAIAGRKFIQESASDPAILDRLQPTTRPVTSANADPVGLAWGHVIIVLQGEGAKAAADFARTITGDPEYAVTYFKSAGYPPVTETALAAPEFTGDAFSAAFTEHVGNHARPNPLWVYPQFAQLEQILGEQVQAVLIGRASPKEGLSTARERMQELI